MLETLLNEAYSVKETRDGRYYRLMQIAKSIRGKGDGYTSFGCRREAAKHGTHTTDQWKPWCDEIKRREMTYIANPQVVADIRGYMVEHSDRPELLNRWKRALVGMGVEQYPGITAMPAKTAQFWADLGWGRWTPIVEELRQAEAAAIAALKLDSLYLGSVSYSRAAAEWHAVPGAERYMVRWWVKGDRYNTFKREVALTNSKTIDGLSPETAYVVEVGARVNGVWQPQHKSPEVGFTTQSPPEVSIAAGPDVTEGGDATFTLTANRALDADLTVNVDVTASGDYGATTGAQTVTIGTGGTTTLTVATSDDWRDEPKGSVTVTLAPGSGYTVSGSQGSATVAVKDNDDPLLVTMTMTSKPTITEGEDMVFTLTANPAPQGDLTVNVMVSQKICAANCGNHVVVGPRTVTIGASGTATLTVETVDDAANEDRVRVSVALTAGRGYRIGSPNEGTAVVFDNDLPEISIIGGAGVTEGDNVVFTLTADPVPASVGYAGDHLRLEMEVKVEQQGRYGANLGKHNVRFSVGQATATLTVPTHNDRADEPHGSVTATVIAGPGYTVSPTQRKATVTVHDDDDAPTVSVTGGGSVTEGDDAVFTITASPELDDNLEVNVTVSQSGDYGVTTGSQTVTLSRHYLTKTLTVSTTDDGAKEADGSVTVTVEPSGKYDVSATQGSATVAVADNGPTVASLSVGSVTASGAVAQWGAGPGAHRYRLQWWVKGDRDNTFERVAFQRVAGRTNSRAIDGLSPETTYVVEVVAKVHDVWQYDQKSPQVEFTTLPSLDSLSVGSVTARGATAEWRAVPGAERYMARWWVKGDRDNTLKFEAVTNNSKVIDGLSPETTYVVEVVARVDGAWQSDHKSPRVEFTTASPPEVSITGGNEITEGSDATFTLTTSPAPVADLTVSVEVHGASHLGVAAGTQTVTIPISGTAKLAIPTARDRLKESNGVVKVELAAGSGYTVGTDHVATVTVSDDDPAISWTLPQWIGTTSVGIYFAELADADRYKVRWWLNGRRDTTRETEVTEAFLLEGLTPATDYRVQVEPRVGGVWRADLKGYIAAFHTMEP